MARGVLWFGFLPLVAQGTWDPEGTEALRKMLEIPVISASKTLQPLAKAPAKLAVITAEDIRLRGYLDFEEILHDLAGIDFSRGMGVEYSTVYLRGFRGSNTDRFLLIWDGMIQNDIWKQSLWLSRQYPLSAIERIEVLYGPASLLYGANAMAGIINVILKQPLKSQSLHVQTTAGSLRTGLLETHVAGQAGEWGYAFTGRAFRTDGVDLNGRYWTDWTGRRRRYDLTFPGDYDMTASSRLVIQGGLPTWEHGGVRRTMDGRTEAQARDWFVQGGLTFRGFSLKALSWRNEESQDPWYTAQDKLQSPWAPTGSALALEWAGTGPGGSLLRSYARMRTSGLDPKASYALKFKSHFKPGDPLDLKVYQMNPTVFYRLFNREWRLGQEVSLRGARLSGVAGLEYTQTHVQENYHTRTLPTAPWSPTPRHRQGNLAGYGQFQWDPTPSLGCSGGLRRDYNYHLGEEGGFGHLTTGRLTFSWRPSFRRFLHLIYGQSFQEPPSFQKFSTVPQVRDLPSPGLRPERLDALEVAFGEGLGEGWHLTLSAYATRVDNLIQEKRVPFGSGSTNQFQNVGGLRIQGLEGELRGYLGRSLSVQANVTATRVLQVEKERRYGDIAPWKANLLLDWEPGGRWNLSLRGHYVSARDTVNWDSSSPYVVRRVGEYATLDASVAWLPGPAWEVRLHVLNLLDREYYDPGPRSADGRSYPGAILQPPARGYLSVAYRK